MNIKAPSLSPRRCRVRAGLTLIECMMALVILMLAVLAANFAVAAGRQHAREGELALNAVRLLEDMVEEIISLPYADPDGELTPGPEVDETGRPLFDNIDDFHNYQEEPGGLVDFSGNPYDSNYQVFVRAVTVTYGSESPAGMGTINGVTVNVAVKDDRGMSWDVTRFVPEPVE